MKVRLTKDDGTQREVETTQALVIYQEGDEIAVMGECNGLFIQIIEAADIIGQATGKQIAAAAERLADKLREEFGEPKPDARVCPCYNSQCERIPGAYCKARGRINKRDQEPQPCGCTTKCQGPGYDEAAGESWREVCRVCELIESGGMFAGGACKKHPKPEPRDCFGCDNDPEYVESCVRCGASGKEPDEQTAKRECRHGEDPATGDRW